MVASHPKENRFCEVANTDLHYNLCCNDYRFNGANFPTIHNRLRSWNQFSVHSLLHLNAIAHSPHSSLFLTFLWWTELKIYWLTVQSTTLRIAEPNLLTFTHSQISSPSNCTEPKADNFTACVLRSTLLHSELSTHRHVCPALHWTVCSRSVRR
jgi:hypothetical protein